MKNKILATLVGSGALLGSGNAAAIEEQEWGIAAMFRTASIPYDTSGGDQTVSSFVPMLFFKNDYVFIDGTEMGATYLNLKMRSGN